LAEDTISLEDAVFIDWFNVPAYERSDSHVADE
jgi:hypothetical protein